MSPPLADLLRVCQIPCVRTFLHRASWCLILAVGFAQAAETPPPATWPLHVLKADKVWFVNLPQGKRVDASALLRRPDGALLTLNDQATALYRMNFREGTNSIDLEPLPGCLTREQLAPFAAEKIQRYDLEGLAQDPQGRIYISEESN